ALQHPRVRADDQRRAPPPKQTPSGCTCNASTSTDPTASARPSKHNWAGQSDQERSAGRANQPPSQRNEKVYSDPCFPTPVLVSKRLCCRISSLTPFRSSRIGQENEPGPFIAFFPSAHGRLGAYWKST